MILRFLAIFFLSSSIVLANTYEDKLPFEKSIDSNLNIDTTKFQKRDPLIFLKLIGGGYTSTTND